MTAPQNQSGKTAILTKEVPAVKNQAPVAQAQGVQDTTPVATQDLATKVDTVIEGADPAPQTQAPASPAPAPAPVVETPAVVVVKDQEPVAAAVSSGPTGIESVDRAIKDVPAAYAIGILRLVEYTAAMAPKRPVSSEDGAAHQVRLYRLIQAVINKNPEYFEALFTAMLRLFEHHKDGAFHETAVFRFMESVNLGSDDRHAFLRLVNLIKVLGPIKSRAVAIKQTNVLDSLRYGLTEEGRQRVLNYFKI